MIPFNFFCPIWNVCSTELIFLPLSYQQPQTPTHLEDITEIIRKDTERDRSKFETPSVNSQSARNQVSSNEYRQCNLNSDFKYFFK